MIAPLAVPLLVLGAMLLAALRGADVYEAMTEGAKKGLQLTWSILPSLLVIFPALRLLRAAGVPELLGQALRPATAWEPLSWAACSLPPRWAYS